MRLRNGKAMPTIPRKPSSRSKTRREKNTSNGLTEGPLHSRELCGVSAAARETAASWCSAHP